jgi:phosphoglycerol transferase MdoB-like AlkP superfamily enzyme
MAVSMAGLQIAALLPLWLSEGYQVVVTGDHGMNTFGIHGGTENIQRDTPLYIFSDKVVKGRFEAEPVSQLNIAPLLCKLLGLSPGEAMIEAQIL